MDSDSSAMRFLLFFLFSFIVFADNDNDAAVEMSAMDLNYGVIAYECDRNLQALEEKQKKRIGQVYRFCFQPNSIASEGNVSIKQIDSWEWTFDEYVQQAVIDGKGVGGVTSVRCQDGGNLCFMDSMLITSFFENPGSVFGTGTVSFTSGTGNVPAQLNLFQFKFNFNFQGEDGEIIKPEDVAELMKEVDKHNAGVKAAKDEEPGNEEL